MTEVIEKHRSHGPHIQLSDSIIFLTWRLAFTLPQHIKEVFNEIKKTTSDIEKKSYLLKFRNWDKHSYKIFLQYDEHLGKYQHSGLSLNEPAVSKIIKTAFHHYDGDKYLLHAYCIMSNHVHLVLKPCKDKRESCCRISHIVRKIKSFSGKEINTLQNTEGQLWDNFYFDRMIRDYDDYRSVINYVLNNPVKAGLVDDWQKWKDSYFNPELMAGFI